MKDWKHIKKEDLGKESSIELEIFDHEQDIYYEIARMMFDEIKANNDKGKKTVFICPVGPVGQYRKFARMVNEYKLPLNNVYIFNMDEYLDDNKQPMTLENPLSFKNTMEKELYSRIDEEYNVPKDQRFFPEPGKEAFYWNKMLELGGVDICFGGVGINGHIAFNEPPEEHMSLEDFRNVGTRVLEISRETRTINAAMGCGGCIEAMPKWCITLGMKEILNSRKIVLGMFREWQKGIIRQLMYGEITARVPVSLLQEHKNVKILASPIVAEEPIKNN